MQCRLPVKTLPSQAFHKKLPARNNLRFQAFGDSNKRKEPTATLTIEKEHVPISVSIGDKNSAVILKNGATKFEPLDSTLAATF